MIHTVRPPIKIDLSVQQLLEWAFGREKVRLEASAEVEPEGYRPGVSTIWVMMQRGNLGCKIDGGGSSDPHEDAEVVAAVLANLPSNRGGFQMAVQVAELARAGMVPDAMVGATPRCVPVRWRQHKNGWFAKIEVAYVITHLHRGRKVERAVEWCPVAFTPTAAQIAASRRAYLDWWAALQEVQVNLRACGMLRRHRVNQVMPPLTPWSD